MVYLGFAPQQVLLPAFLALNITNTILFMANSNTVKTIEWRLIEDIEQLKQYTEQWQELVQTSQANLFSSPQWIMTWIDIYWQSSWQLKVISGFNNNKLIAIAPLYLQIKSGLLSISTLLPLGQGEPEESEVLSEFQDVVITEAFNYAYI